MFVSVFQLFSIGIGPSSSHTVGPIRAACQFMEELEDGAGLDRVAGVQVDLYGSLAMTGIGHGTDIALMLGLEGNRPEELDPDHLQERLSEIRDSGKIRILGKKEISFDEESDIIFHKGRRLPYHSNAMRFRVTDQNGKEIASDIYYSVGGGFIVKQSEIFEPQTFAFDRNVPYPFQTFEELQRHCVREGMRIDEIVMANEKSYRSEEEIKQGVFEIWQVMQNCVKRGCCQSGELPGGLKVKRRARDLYHDLCRKGDIVKDPSEVMDWVSLYALAVNEENAAGGRVVTAPTNGAAGVIPAVLHYYDRFTENPSREGILRFFLTACAIGILYKEGASLSAAEMGCQGEIGVACSMAAGGLAAALGGTVSQIENAAEIGMEHNLGLTCDPVGGLVQIPCIERNTMGALKAINASRLALRGKGEHRVRLDHVIDTMRQTGEDMKHIYKETSEGGLARNVPVSVPEC